jgi:hypothetical protein
LNLARIALACVLLCFGGANLVKEKIMSDEKKVALDVLKEIAQDTNVEAHIRVNAAALLLDSGGNPIGGGEPEGGDGG